MGGIAGTAARRVNCARRLLEKIGAAAAALRFNSAVDGGVNCSRFGLS